MSSGECLITKMLNELKTTRSSIKTQTAAITDALDKSNNVLLQIEASRCLKRASNDNSTLYSYNKETTNALAKIVDKFMILVNNDNNLTIESRNVEEYLTAAGQRSDYLGCNIRKLLAIYDTVQHMRAVLDRLELEVDEEQVIGEDGESFLGL